MEVRVSTHGATWEMDVYMPRKPSEDDVPEIMRLAVIEVYDMPRFIEWMQEKRVAGNEKVEAPK
jgi:hypothetical protein